MSKQIFFLLLFFLSASFLAKVPNAQANFANAYLRLDNPTANTALSGTVCAQPFTSGTEAKVVLTFPDSFSVSANASNWSTNVSDIPSGATVWPGIGATASSVSGNAVTFISGDLTVGTLYCFNFSGTSSTTGAAGNDQNGTIATKNSSNAIIDSTTYALSIVTDNQIKITATVPSQVSSLPISIESVTTGSQFSQNTTLDYKITYGSLASSAIPLTIQAQWSQGTIEGSPTPSVDIVDYVIGSASDAYGGATAIVDTVNNTITWTIPSFPGNTVDQTVTFSLKTNTSYTGASSVSFDVSARAISGSTVTPDQTVTQTYLYSAPAASASTPTPTPTAGANAPSGGAKAAPSAGLLQGAPAALFDIISATVHAAKQNLIPFIILCIIASVLLIWLVIFAVRRIRARADARKIEEEMNAAPSPQPKGLKKAKRQGTIDNENGN